MITRYNYEEFFLLYVDNELSPAERKAVEGFVKQNLDLGEELVALQQSVLKPENNVLFENKDLLLIQTEENSLIIQTNYEEYFLLSIDNELDHAATKDVERYIHENPSLLNELSLLQQAKLEPDIAIVFEGKDILYKNEEKKRPIPFAWMSAAAVAILLVTGFLFYINNKLQHPNESTASVQSIKTNEKDSLTQKNKKEQIAVTQPPVDSLNNKEELKAAMIAKDNKLEKQTPVDQHAINKENKKTEDKNDHVAIGPRPKEETQSKNVKPIEIAKANSGNDKEISTGLAVSELSAKPNNLITKTDQSDKTTKTNTEASDVILVAMNDNNIDYIDIDNTSAKKNKLRGIFRRVSRVFEKTTNVDDGNKRSVSIGSFQIALK